MLHGKTAQIDLYDPGRDLFVRLSIRKERERNGLAAYGDFQIYDFQRPGRQQQTDIIEALQKRDLKVAVRIGFDLLRRLTFAGLIEHRIGANVNHSQWLLRGSVDKLPHHFIPIKAVRDAAEKRKADEW